MHTATSTNVGSIVVQLLEVSRVAILKTLAVCGWHFLALYRDHEEWKSTHSKGVGLSLGTDSKSTTESVNDFLVSLQTQLQPFESPFEWKSNIMKLCFCSIQPIGIIFGQVPEILGLCSSKAGLTVYNLLIDSPLEQMGYFINQALGCRSPH